MNKLIKISFLMIVFPMIVYAMQEPLASKIEKEDTTVIQPEELLNELDKIHEKVNEFWKKKKPSKRIDLTKSV